MSEPARRALSELALADFQALLAGWGFNPVHAVPLLRAFYASGGELPASGRSLPRGLPARLREEFSDPAVCVAQRRAAQDGTVKLLLKLRDGRSVESVLMPDYRQDRAAGCISSQVGCALGCGFCATGSSGFERDLSAGEMIEQYLALRRQAAAQGRRLQTVVFMGMGEPLLNLEAVLAAIGRLVDPALDALGCRQITVSTAGVVPGIDALFDSGLPIKLALSLHAPDDETRARLMPLARRWPIAQVLAAAERFQSRNRRTVNVQYLLLKGVNDSPEHARRLAALLRGRRMHVNLLRHSATGASYEASDDEAQGRFLAELSAGGVVAHPRRQRGADIDAACGQLRARL